MEAKKLTEGGHGEKDAVRLGHLGTPHSLAWNIKTYVDFGHGHNADEQSRDQAVYMPLKESCPNLLDWHDFAAKVVCDLDDFQLIDAKSGQHYMGQGKDNADINKPVVVLRYKMRGREILS